MFMLKEHKFQNFYKVKKNIINKNKFATLILTYDTYFFSMKLSIVILRRVGKILFAMFSQVSK